MRMSKEDIIRLYLRVYDENTKLRKISTGQDQQELEETHAEIARCRQRMNTIVQGSVEEIKSLRQKCQDLEAKLADAVASEREARREMATINLEKFKLETSNCALKEDNQRMIRDLDIMAAENKTHCKIGRAHV